MCIAIYQPKNIKINYALFSSCWRVNPDGGGFAVRKDGKIEIHKGFMTLKEFWSGYKKYNGQYDIALHFRIATHGFVDRDNCHPFAIGDGAFIHNGFIPGYGTGLDGRSDTRAFCEDVLNPCMAYSPEWGKKPHEKALIEGCLNGSKAVLLYPETTIILNEGLGTKRNGLWLSNTHPLRESKKEWKNNLKKKWKQGEKYGLNMPDYEYPLDTYDYLMVNRGEEWERC